MSAAQPIPINGLLLTGGKSSRMGRDKASILIDGVPMGLRTWELLQGVCMESYLSLRANQSMPDFAPQHTPVLVDKYPDAGPLAGILTALTTQPDHAWLVLACDLPLLDHHTLACIIAARAPAKLATAYRSLHDGKPEPLCAIYEPAALPRLLAFLKTNKSCPRRFLMQEAADTHLIDLPGGNTLENANTPEELKRIVQSPPLQ